MNYRDESFVDFCDRMLIAEESTNKLQTNSNNYCAIFCKMMSSKGFKSSNKTYYIDNESDTTIIFKIYDDLYSDTGGDYDNGLTVKDKSNNSKMMKAISEVIKEMRNKYENIKIDVDNYRGNGQVTFYTITSNKETRTIGNKLFKEFKNIMNSSEFVNKYGNRCKGVIRGAKLEYGVENSKVIITIYPSLSNIKKQFPEYDERMDFFEELKQKFSDRVDKLYNNYYITYDLRGLYEFKVFKED